MKVTSMHLSIAILLIHYPLIILPLIYLIKVNQVKTRDASLDVRILKEQVRKNKYKLKHTGKVTMYTTMNI